MVSLWTVNLVLVHMEKFTRYDLRGRHGVIVIFCFHMLYACIKPCFICDVKQGVHKNGETIAVKLLHSMPGLDDKCFEEEFQNLSRLQHKNIVRLIGFCHETQREFVPHEGNMIFADSKRMALCFEYMHNGSLDKYIFGIIVLFFLV